MDIDQDLDGSDFDGFGCLCLEQDILIGMCIDLLSVDGMVGGFGEFGVVFDGFLFLELGFCFFQQLDEFFVGFLFCQFLVLVDLVLYLLVVIVLEVDVSLRLVVDFVLFEELFFIFSCVDLSGDLEGIVVFVQVVLLVIEFGFIGIGDVNFFLVVYVMCLVFGLYLEFLLYCNVMIC